MGVLLNLKLKHKNRHNSKMILRLWLLQFTGKQLSGHLKINMESFTSHQLNIFAVPFNKKIIIINNSATLSIFVLIKTCKFIDKIHRRKIFPIPIVIHLVRCYNRNKLIGSLANTLYKFSNFCVKIFQNWQNLINLIGILFWKWKWIKNWNSN